MQSNITPFEYFSGRDSIIFPWFSNIQALFKKISTLKLDIYLLIVNFGSIYLTLR